MVNDRGSLKQKHMTGQYCVAYCTLCNKSFSIAALGITALHIHAKGSKHISRLPLPTKTTLNFQCVKNVQEKQSNATEEKT